MPVETVQNAVVNCDSVFFALLRTALWGGEAVLPCSLSADEWGLLYDTAVRQSVHGLMFDAVRGLPPGTGLSGQTAARWLVETERIEHDFARISKLVSSMTEFWQRNGVRAVLLKGTEVASFYNTPSHRVIGDIDWWFPEEDGMEKACRLIRDKGLAITADSDGDCWYVMGDIVVEHHRRGLTSDDEIGRMLLINRHILHHAMVSGIGMRHLCDMAMAYRHYAGRYDSKAYRTALADAGLLKWTDLLNAVLVHFLGMPSGLLPTGMSCPDTVSKDEVRLVDMIMADGNFGLDKKNRYDGLMERAVFFLKYAPRRFALRWLRLVAGRARKNRLK